MVIDILFFLTSITYMFFHKYTIYVFSAFLWIYYKKYPINKLFIIIMLINVVYLFVVSFDNYIVNILYDFDHSGKMIFQYKNYLYIFGVYFIFFSLFYLYFSRKKIENYLVLLPIIAVEYRIVLVMIFVFLLKIDYTKLFMWFKNNYLYFTTILIAVFVFTRGSVVSVYNFYITSFLIYILIFMVTILFVIYKNAYITKLINLLLLEIIFVFPFNMEIVKYSVLIILMLIIYKFYQKGIKYIKKLNTPLFLSFLLIYIILISSYFLHICEHKFIINKENTFLFNMFDTPIKGYLISVFCFVFLVAFVLEGNKIIYQKLIKVFILSVFISEIFSYLMIFDASNILSFFNIMEYNRCDPAPFTNHIQYSVFLSVALILMIDMFLKTKSFYRYILLLFIFTAFLNLFLNGGRTGQLGFILGISFYIWNYLNNFKKFILFLISLFFILFLVFNINTPCKNNKRLLKGSNSFQEVLFKNNYTSSWGVRLAMDIITLKYMASHPSDLLLGIAGTNDKEKIFQYAKNTNTDIYEALKYFDELTLHNEFMQLLLDGGIFVMLALFYIFYYLIKMKVNNESLKYSLLIILFIYLNQGVILFSEQKFILELFVISIILGDKKNDFSINSHIQ